MHALYSQADEISHEVIGAAIEVHKIMGPGLLESIYEWCLTKELELRGRNVVSQEAVTIQFKQFEKQEDLRFDLLVDKCLLVVVKAVKTVHPIHKATLLSYMKLLDVPVGLVINFHELRLVDGVSRMFLPGANSQ